MAKVLLGQVPIDRMGLKQSEVFLLKKKLICLEIERARRERRYKAVVEGFL